MFSSSTLTPGVPIHRLADLRGSQSRFFSRFATARIESAIVEERRCATANLRAARAVYFLGPRIPVYDNSLSFSCCSAVHTRSGVGFLLQRTMA
jgi:hypothetical protein